MLEGYSGLPVGRVKLPWWVPFGGIVWIGPETSVDGKAPPEYAGTLAVPVGIMVDSVSGSQLKCGLETPGLALYAALEKTPVESGWSVGMAEWGWQPLGLVLLVWLELPSLGVVGIGIPEG